MGPNFICIGAQKAGTSWLYSVLSDYPGVRMPPVKELHYFDADPKYPSRNLHSDPSLIARLGSKEWWKGLGRCGINLSREFRWNSLIWHYQYMFGKCDDSWYLRLFSGHSEEITGDITPAYSILEEDDIARVYELCPNAKIIFILRNPIDRYWSAFKYNAKLGKIAPTSFEEITLDEFKELSNDQVYSAKGDYITTYNRWSKYFDDSQIYVGFFDDLRDKPLDFIEAITNFIGIPRSVEYLKRLERTACEGKNTTKSHKMPQDVRAYLRDRYASQVDEISDRFGGAASRW